LVAAKRSAVARGVDPAGRGKNPHDRRVYDTPAAKSKGSAPAGGHGVAEDQIYLEGPDIYRRDGKTRKEKVRWQ